jgi:hypothetical protein
VQLDPEIRRYRSDPTDRRSEREQPEGVLGQSARGDQRNQKKCAFTGDVRKRAIRDQGDLPPVHRPPRIMNLQAFTARKVFPAP